MTERSLRGTVFATGLGALVLVATACGGGSPGAGVAHIGTGTTVPLPAGPSVTSVRALQSDELAYARCMRSHGEPDYPDPGSQGQGALSAAKAGPSLNFNSPQFQAAQRACRNFLPSGGVASPAEQEAVTAKAVEFAQCMRAHGLPTFPDPMTGAHGGYFIAALSGPLSPSNPQFVRAQKACQKLAGGIY